MKKVLFGFAWFFAFYMGTCVVVGAVAGAKLAADEKYRHNDAALQHDAGVAGAKAVEDNLGIIVGAAVTLSIAGASLGLLPGTGSRRSAAPPEMLVGARMSNENRYRPA